jgi:hypothetical protein
MDSKNLSTARNLLSQVVPDLGQELGTQQEQVDGKMEHHLLVLSLLSLNVGMANSVNSLISMLKAMT